MKAVLFGSIRDQIEARLSHMSAHCVFRRFLVLHADGIENHAVVALGAFLANLF